MCGIFAYIGNKPTASQIIFEGLKTLEYRGYDSWGIATKIKNKKAKSKDTIVIEKQIGKLPDKILNSKFLNLNSNAGIGHTRWATHGGVTIENSHPHRDCAGNIAVLHNGIIENYQEIKDQLIKRGHKFLSETDTEIIPHMLEDYMNKNSKSEYRNSKQIQNTNNQKSKLFENFDLENSNIVSDFGFRASDLTFSEALRLTFNQLRGLNAIVAINIKTEEIVAAKNGSPLIIGIGKDELFLSSDLTGILPHTKKVVFMKDNEMVSLRRVPKDDTPLTMTMDLFSLPNGEKLKPQIETIHWKIEKTVKGKYEHFMLKEIHEQPLVIDTIAKTYTKQIEDLSEVIKKAKGTFFIGSGTAFHACLAGTYLFSKIAKRHVNTAPASEFNYLEDFLTKDSLIIPLSQSGETIDVVEPLNHAKQKGSTIMALVNALGSTIYRMGDYKLLLGAGPEKAVASTKAYTAKIAILTLLTYSLSVKLNEGKKLLTETAKEVDRLIKKHSEVEIKKVANVLAKKEHIYIIGRGGSYATALEGALKIKEVSYIHTEGLAGGELKHGTIALIDKGTPCIVLAPDDETYDAIISNATEIKARGGLIIGISHIKSPVFDEWIEVKNAGSPLITQVIPFQLLAYHLAIIKKLDPDKPRNLAKSVTVK